MPAVPRRRLSRRLLRRCLLPLLCLLAVPGTAAPLSSAPLPAAPPPAEPARGTADTPFGEAIDVRLVQVETVVTGRRGERIHGLEAEDFRLLVDGREVPIEVFEEVRLQHLDPGGEVPELLRASREQATGGPAVHYLIFIDDYFTRRSYRQRLLDNLIEQAASLRPGERMAVVRYAGLELELLAGWTDDPDVVVRALRTARDRTPRELVRRARLGGANPVENARVAAAQILQVTEAMAATMRSLSGVEGRKVVLPVSTGWPFDPSLDVQTPIRRARGDVGFLPEVGPSLESDFPEGATELTQLGERLRYLNESLLTPVIDAANLLGYTIFPLGVAADDIGPRWVALRNIALETGGSIATLGAANPEPLNPVRDDLRSYYVLGFTPDWEWDDQRHELEVEVNVPKAKARHRKNFLDLSRHTRLALAVEEALLVPEAGGDLEVELGEPERVERRMLEVPVEVSVPADWATLLPAGEGSLRGRLELRVAARDELGNRSPLSVVPIDLAADAGAERRGELTVVEGRVRLRRADQRVVLSLYDTVSGESRLAAIDFSP